MRRGRGGLSSMGHTGPAAHTLQHTEGLPSKPGTACAPTLAQLTAIPVHSDLPSPPPQLKYRHFPKPIVSCGLLPSSPSAGLEGGSIIKSRGHRRPRGARGGGISERASRIALLPKRGRNVTTLRGHHPSHSKGAISRTACQASPPQPRTPLPLGTNQAVASAVILGPGQAGTTGRDPTPVCYNHDRVRVSTLL